MVHGHSIGKSTKLSCIGTTFSPNLKVISEKLNLDAGNMADRQYETNVEKFYSNIHCYVVMAVQ